MDIIDLERQFETLTGRLFKLLQKRAKIQEKIEKIFKP